MEKPKQLKTINLESLVSTCQQHLDYIDSDDYYEDNDDAHYIYEEAMRTIFGKDVFNYINERTN